MLCPLPTGLGVLLGRLLVTAMFTLSYSIKLHKQSDISDNGAGVAPFQLLLDPPRLQQLPIDEYYDVHINCSSYGAHSHYDDSNSTDTPPTTTTSPPRHTTDSEDPSTSSSQSYNYVARITSNNPAVAIPVESDHVVRPLLFSNRTDQIYVPVYVDSENIFSVYATHVGHVALLVQVYAHSDALSLEERLEYLAQSPQPPWDLHEDTVAILEYHVSVIRHVRVVDVVFECVIAAVATLNAFSMGLSTDWPSLRHHIRHPAALIIGLLCQFVIMPVVSMGFPSISCIIH